MYAFSWLQWLKKFSANGVHGKSIFFVAVKNLNIFFIVVMTTLLSNVSFLLFISSVRFSRKI
jgi:hypothetical protein